MTSEKTETNLAPVFSWVILFILFLLVVLGFILFCFYWLFLGLFYFDFLFF